MDEPTEALARTKLVRGPDRDADLAIAYAAETDPAGP